MIYEQELVLQFHKAFGIAISHKPKIPDKKTCELRKKLIEEEFNELKEAIDNNNMVEAADGLADLLYVIYGTAISFGLDMEPIFDEVHRSNMTKIGGHKREDGKWIKPETYEPPDLISIIVKQKS